MKTVITNTFDARDYELLNNIPLDPCTRCVVNSSFCCGCSARLNYENQMKEYKQKNLIEIMEKILKTVNIQKQIGEIRRLKKEKSCLIKELQDIGLDISKIKHIEQVTETTGNLEKLEKHVIELATYASQLENERNLLIRELNARL